jgi:SIR2-like domain
LSLRDADWDELLYSIDEQACTPFIGAGACSFLNEGGKPWLPLGRTISTKMSDDYKYPLDDFNELDKVSQFVAIQEGDMVPKNFIVRWLKRINTPDFSKKEYENTPHAVLADLKLPLYITTNYDEFMEAALKSRNRFPTSEFCRWNAFLKNQKNVNTVFEKIDYKPSQDSPLVYHLHGHLNHPQSLVLTETDYLDFLINLSKEEILPDQISTALNSTSLLFVGYSLRDINFRFIFRGLMHLLGEGIGAGLQLPSIAVQFPSGFSQEKKEQAIGYLTDYTKNMFKVRVYWGDIMEFSKELRDRWEKFKNA